MDNPYDLPWVLIGIASGVLAGILPSRPRWIAALRLFVVVLGTYFCWRLLLSSVEWAYNHPFNPNDGAAKTFAYLFGWLVALLLLIGPTFVCTLLAKIIYGRIKKRRGAA